MFNLAYYVLFSVRDDPHSHEVSQSAFGSKSQPADSAPLPELACDKVASV